MPLQSALDKLAHESDAIASLSRANARPPGPFTSAYLYLSGGNVFSLVRDATEAEKRPFGRLLPSLPKGRASSPLRKLARARGTPHEFQATLAAAEEVIDTMAAEHSMARARREVEGFAARHEANTARAAELERALEEVIHSPKKEVAQRSVDEAIAAEEEALRALEESLAPLRRRVAEHKAAMRSPARSPRSPVSPKISKTPASPRSPLNQSSKASTSPLTTPRAPRAPKPARPAQSPNLGTSLRASTSRTPARQLLQTPRVDITRFSPLTLVATPRTRLGAPAPGSTIVSRMRASITPAPRSAYRSSVLSRSTARMPSPIAEPLIPDPTPSKTPKASPKAKLTSQPVPKPKPKPSPAKSPTTRKVPKANAQDGINMSLDAVGVASASIRRALPPEIWRMLGAEPGADPGATIAHLEALARASLPAPPSPTSSEVPSTASTAADAPPVTREAVLVAHLCLGMLRRLGPGAVDDKANHVPEADVKAELIAVAGAKGWDGADALAHNVIYQARGHKLLGTVWRDRKIHFRK